MLSAHMARLQKIKERAVRSILPHWDHVSEPYLATIVAFSMSYSMGRTILAFCNEFGLDCKKSKILIVGAAGGRDYHWLKGFGYTVDTVDLGHHPWSPTSYVGDACDAKTWARIPVKYDLIIMCDILEHLPHDFSALEHARTVLAANGHIFLSIPYAHDLERTHVRAYSYVTLSRLLALAGYEIVWKRERPGALESTPLTTLTNYALASLMPSVDLGARALHFLLRAEFAVNERTRGLYARLGRSPQRGIILAARAAPVPAKDHVLMNREDFIPEAATRHN